MPGISFRIKVCVYVSLALRDKRRPWDVLFYCFCISLIFSHSLTWRGRHDKRCQPQSLQKFAISSGVVIPQLQNCDAEANFTASPGELKEMAAVQWFPQSMVAVIISAIIKCIYGTKWSLSCYNTRIFSLYEKYYWCLLKTYGFRLLKSRHCHKPHAHTHTHTINWSLCIGARFKYLIFSLLIKMPLLMS